ncbi:MAG: peroxide stress protein YaaA [Desulfococcaceae bacterium]
MLLILSPSKSLDFDTPPPLDPGAKPRFLKEAAQLMDRLRPLSVDDLRDLMDVSEKLGKLNHQRFREWSEDHGSDSAKPAVYAYTGDVYDGLRAWELSKADMDWAEHRLRILSGLYGVLRPLARIRPYRLEMGIRLENAEGKNLYEFWEDRITETLNKDLAEVGGDVLLNLASQEYAKAVDLKRLGAREIVPKFKDWKNGEYKFISFYAKKARGLMARFVIQNRLESAEELKDFDLEGYRFSEEFTESMEAPVFTRKES